MPRLCWTASIIEEFLVICRDAEKGEAATAGIFTDKAVKIQDLGGGGDPLGVGTVKVAERGVR